jgi:hypothetical protein
VGVRPSWRTVWLEFLGPEGDADIKLCGVCGGTGVLDTRGRFYASDGEPWGVLRWCICPNGRVWKRRSKLPAPTEAIASRAREQIAARKVLG